MNTSARPSSPTRNSVLFWLAFVLLFWLAHSLAYILHEYAHSFTAWLLGWKSNPLDIIYGHFTLPNVVFLSDFDENVDYAPIFAAGKGPFVALIGIAGILFANAPLYFLSRRVYARARLANLRILALFAFLFCLMNAGNFLDYVPVRTFTDHADMAHVELGLRISPWWVAIVLGIPTALAIVHLFNRLLPDARGFLFPHRIVPQAILTTVAAVTLFAYCGSSGMYGYGPISHWISFVCFWGLLPLALILSWPHRHPGPSVP